MGARDWWPYFNLRLHNLIGADAASIMSPSPLSGSLPAIVLVGPPRLSQAWRTAFRGVSVVSVVSGDILAQPPGTALVSPANSFGVMRGGLDKQYAKSYRDHGVDIENRVMNAIRESLYGELPLGQALVVPTPAHPTHPFLIVAPTMRTPQSITHSMNPYLAFRAVLLAVAAWNQCNPDNRIDRIACPGLGTGVGHVPVRRAARQMRAAWDSLHGQGVESSMTKQWFAERRLRWR